MTDWFRSWHGAPTDTKWLLIGRKANVAPGIVSAIAWSLMDHASQSEERGDISSFDVETYAVYSGFDDGDIERVIAAMTDKGVIQNNRLASWERRQPKREDASTERVRKHRESSGVTPVPQGNATTGNAAKRNATHGNAPEERRVDTETETETENVEPSVPPHERGSPPKSADPLAFALVDAFAKATGRQPKHITGRDRAEARTAFLPMAGEFCPADVTACVAYLRADPFWAEPGKLTARKVAATLPEWASAGRPITPKTPVPIRGSPNRDINLSTDEILAMARGESP